MVGFLLGGWFGGWGNAMSGPASAGPVPWAGREESLAQSTSVSLSTTLRTPGLLHAE
jgi:hypothetical protein